MYVVLYVCCIICIFYLYINNHSHYNLHLILNIQNYYFLNDPILSLYLLLNEDVQMINTLFFNF